MKRGQILHEKLKPGTPWQIRRKIWDLENSCDRLTNWFCRITILAGFDVVAVLVICLIHAAIT